MNGIQIRTGEGRGVRGEAASGMTLLEVLAAIGVLSIGLLGLAALLPAGRYTIGEATKADRAGQCGRAALRDVVVRRMLDSTNWTANPISPSGPQSFLIDPLGVTNGLGAKLANVTSGSATVTTSVPRISLASLNTAPLAAAAFTATDDLLVNMPSNMNLKLLPSGLASVSGPLVQDGRPLNLSSGTLGAVDYAGQYTWFLTVTPQAGSTTRFTVSVVVCYNRNLTPGGERAVSVKTFFDATPVNGTSVALGGGSVQLGRPIDDMFFDAKASPPTTAGIAIKENDWVALCNANGLCRWYRVGSVGEVNEQDASQLQCLTLVGPDWQPQPGDQLVALGQSVVGVYTGTIELDTDPTWKN